MSEYSCGPRIVFTTMHSTTLSDFQARTKAMADAGQFGPATDPLLVRGREWAISQLNAYLNRADEIFVSTTFGCRQPGQSLPKGAKVVGVIDVDGRWAPVDDAFTGSITRLDCVRDVDPGHVCDDECVVRMTGPATWDYLPSFTIPVPAGVTDETDMDARTAAVCDWLRTVLTHRVLLQAGYASATDEYGTYVLKARTGPTGFIPALVA